MKSTIKMNNLIFIIILGTMTAFGPLLSDMYSPALPLVQEDFHISTSQAQLTLAIAMMGIAIGQFVIGVIADRMSRQKLAIMILSIVCLASIISTFNINSDLFMVMRFIQGIAGGGAIVLARAIVGDRYEGQRLSHFFTALMVVNGIISILAPLVSGFILSVSVWQTIFIVLACLSIILLIFVALHPQIKETAMVEDHTKHFTTIFKDFGHLLKTPRFTIPMLLQGVTYIMIFSYSAGAPFIVQNVYHLNPQTFSLLMVATGIGLIITSQLSNICLRYFEQIRVLSAFITIQVIGAVLVVIVLWMHLPLYMLIIGLLVSVTPVTAVGPLAFSLAMQARTGGSGSASSLLGLFQFALGSAISPLIGIQGAHSVTPFIIIVSITGVLLVVLLYIVYKNAYHWRSA